MKRSSVLIGALVAALAVSTAFAQSGMSGNMSLGTVHIAGEGCNRAVGAALGAQNANERGCWLGQPRPE